MNRAIHTLLLVVLLTTTMSWGQNPYSVDYSIEDGLPTSNVYGVFEDTNGFLWFATDVGVLRYDGYEFQHFNTDNGLGDNEVFKIVEDQQSRIWFLTLNGKLSYFSDGIFYNGGDSSTVDSLSHSAMVIDFHIDNDGTLYFLFIDGHVSILSPDGTTTTSNFSDPPRSYSIWRKDGKTFILNGSYIASMDGSIRIPLEQSFYADAAYRYTFYDEETYFFSSRNTIFKYTYGDTYSGLLTIPEAGDIIFLSYSHEKLYIGTRNGLYIQSGDNMERWFTNDQVSGVIQDRQGSLWVTTLTSGIKFIPNEAVRTYTLSENNRKVSALLKDTRERLWVGTSDGTLLKPSARDSMIPYLMGMPEEESKVKKLRLMDDAVIAITRSIYTFEEERVRHFRFSSNDILKYDDQVFFAGSNHTGQLEFSQFRGLETASKKSIATVIAGNSLLGKRSNVLARVEDRVYVGTSTGLYVYESGDVSMITSPNEELNTSILDMKYDADRDEVWIATNSKGVVVLAADTVKQQFTTLKGLNSNTCYVLKRWDGHGFFVGNNKGINLIVQGEGDDRVLNYTDMLHLRNEKVNALEFIGDELYVATDGGLLSFSPKSIDRSSSVPHLLIDEVWVNGEKRLDIDELKHWENAITVGFTGISPRDFGALSYEYKLNNEPVWTPILGRQLEFKELSYGSYKVDLRVKGKNGLYSTPETVTFTIAPPFWKTIPFVIGAVLVALLLLIWGIRSAIRRVKSEYDRQNKRLQTEQEKALLEKKMIELEQKALRLQMNPHFIFNTLNTIKGYYSGGEIKDANLYISRFSKLLRMILENDEHLVPLDKEIEMLELYIKLIQLRYENVFEYTIDIDPGIVKEEIGIPPLLVQPLVENAIIHGLAPSDRNGELEVSFRIKDDTLQCSVKDNGVGFSDDQNDKPEGYQSKALQITRDRIRFVSHPNLNGHFKIVNLPEPGGTEVIVGIPVLKLW